MGPDLCIGRVCGVKAAVRDQDSLERATKICEILNEILSKSRTQNPGAKLRVVEPCELKSRILCYEIRIEN